MRQTCKFCKERDLGQVVPGLAVDLEKAIETGVVLDTGVLEEFNNIDSPTNVVTRVQDVFHAMELKKAYLQAGKITPDSGTSGSMEHSSSSVSSAAAAASATTE